MPLTVSGPLGQLVQFGLVDVSPYTWKAGWVTLNFKEDELVHNTVLRNFVN